jgi:vancomycin permeability regulator SanA
MISLMRMVFRVCLTVFALGAVVLLFPRLLTGLYTLHRIFPIESVPPKGVAIVFGAGLWRDGSPTPVLYDRVAAAAQLYFSGKVEKIILSGDNRFVYYNEPGAMRAAALELGVPEEDIILDYAGRRTYDTCYRARDIFGVREAILVTQGFHLPRALYVCNSLGVEAVGVVADLRVYRKSSRLYWNIRELPATLVALWEVHVSKPLPVLGEAEPILLQ